MTTISPFGRPLYIMLKPAGPNCNLSCRYCYYLEKGGLYAGAGERLLSEDLLEEFIRQYIAMQTIPQVLFTWHGGEPLLRPPAFYRRALELQKKYARGRQIDNCLQTNGTLLTDEWCEFLRENRFLVGISIDGPQEFHDRYRRTQAGKPSFDEVMRGIRLLQKHGVEWNAMATVNACNVGNPLAFYRFFREIGCRYLQFTPVVERIVRRADGLTLAPGMSGCAADAREALPEMSEHSVRPEQWGAFLCTLYDEWVRRDVGEIFVQLFDATLANWVGEAPGICSMSERCGLAAVMESNGDVYSCDHFVYPEYRLGNLRQQSLISMMYSERQERFGLDKEAALPRQCRECPFLFACHGECPKNRFLRDRYGEPWLNYLCEGYRRFFRHVAADMDMMKAELDAGRSPAGIMRQKGISAL